MKEIDYLSLDGHSLRTFLTVIEELSVSRAAERLGVTQSAVSHTLDKLRLALGDELFVRSGRGIAATTRALSLREPVQVLLDDIKALTDERDFDVSKTKLSFTVATNDFARDFIFPSLVRQTHHQRLDLRIRFVPSGVPTASMMNENHCDLLITPVPPDGQDIVQVALFEDTLACFYDSKHRDAPSTLEEYLASDRVSVTFSDGQTSAAVLNKTIASRLPPPIVSVPNFAGLASFIRGTTMIATEIRLMGRCLLAELSSATVPFDVDTVTMYMVWHRRNHLDPAHRWFREQIKAIVQSVTTS